MSHEKFREDKTCLNCGHQVEEYYCTHCGQENTETRQPFHFLFTHFIEDFIHYDGSLWTTIRRLFLRPGEVTKEYLAGKRRGFVNPVKLYIFISFITFFVLALFPSKDIKGLDKIFKNKNEVIYIKNKSDLDSLRKINEISDEVYKQLKKTGFTKQKNKTKDTQFFLTSYLNKLQKKLAFKYVEVIKSDLTKEEQKKLFIHNTLSVIPKGLFFYMPIFAFILWLFYNKKKWWYFDHGIYTLHYFSTLLLSTAIITILIRTSDWIGIEAIKWLIRLLNLFFVLYLIYIFYKGANVLYEGKKISNFIKISTVLFINTIIFTILISGLLIYAFLNM